MSTSVLVVRQPIFDRTRRTSAYGLTLRPVAVDAPGTLDADQAGRRVMQEATDLIVDRKITGGRRAYLNVTRDTLVRHHAVLKPGPSLVVEVVGTEDPDAELIGVCRTLRRAGCLIALHDVLPGGWSPELAKVTDVAKVDVGRNGPTERRNVARYFQSLGVRLVAEGVHTEELWRQAAEASFEAFEGHFFTERGAADGSDVPASRLNVLRLLHGIYQPDADLGQIEQLIKAEVSLSLKLVSYMNTAAFGFRQRVTSVRQALMMLGVNGIRKWAAVIAVAGAGGSRPFELVVTSVNRAKFCEMLATDARMGDRAEDAFFMGLFSLLDVLLGRPLAEVVDTLAMAPDVRQALLGGANPMRRLHDLVLAYERGDWDGVVGWASTLGLDARAIPDRYCAALEWGNSLATGTPGL
jgi:EAL and modified HD-GYP domain-containing signal transduction protein